MKQKETLTTARPKESMMQKSGERQKAVLAFDTSNYTTSVAICDLSGNILADERRLLRVQEGERGLRQSHALFQHVENLSELVDLAKKKADRSGPVEICAVAVSRRPRPVKGSYMPVFRGGISVAESIAAVLGVPVYGFSHQEGHIAAVCGAMEDSVRTVSFHMSGGTGEILLTQGCRPVKIIGGTQDLSFGQLIDRVGVAMGYGFPAGAALDKIACRNVSKKGFSYSSRGNTKIENPVTSPIHIKGAYANLSGIETQLLREIERRSLKPGDGCGEECRDGKDSQRDATEGNAAEDTLITELFCRIADGLVRLSVNALKHAETDTMIFVGGVSASAFLRAQLDSRLSAAGYRCIFGDAVMSSDNACGIARLGAAQYRRERKAQLLQL